MSTVTIADTQQGLKLALDDIFAPFGGVHRAVPQRGGTVYLKPNGVHFAPHTHTDPRALDALLGYLRTTGERPSIHLSCNSRSILIQQ